jgi:diaminohydroxyphosphoribosylaminopyrimidine deaminase / 5-amino-6-(5-phosphoribosylamino)uracil reductase
MAPPSADADRRFMQRALELARRGQGFVEPNPMVGCVLVRDGAIVGEGWHQRFGGPHAEIEALRAAGEAARGATAYVTLEPCCHTGKTPPCTAALVAAGVRRVVAACQDPNSAINGRGLAELAAAGIACEADILGPEARELISPFAMLMTQQRPWMIAKWAMTLDGHMATRTGDSKWISGEASRALVHQLRGRMDAILVGRRTVEADDPLLTARPPGPRVPARIVVDSAATLSLESQLVRTAGEAPVIVAASADAPAARCDALRQRDVDVWQSSAMDRDERLRDLVAELGLRRLTNVLVEGGSQILGTLFNLQLIDEVHVFIAPKILGGAGASARHGGVEHMADSLQLVTPTVEAVGADAYIHGRIDRSGP